MSATLAGFCQEGGGKCGIYRRTFRQTREGSRLWRRRQALPFIDDFRGVSRKKEIASAVPRLQHPPAELLGTVIVCLLNWTIVVICEVPTVRVQESESDQSLHLQFRHVVGVARVVAGLSPFGRVENGPRPSLARQRRSVLAGRADF